MCVCLNFSFVVFNILDSVSNSNSSSIRCTELEKSWCDHLFSQYG
jgi:hypothetical protein